MTRAYQFRQGSSLVVTYPDFPSFNIRAHNMKLIQSAGNQDVVELTYNNFSSFYVRAFKTGVPIQISWSNNKVKGNFYGYVYEVESDKKLSQKKPVIVRAIGSGLPLKQNECKIWINKTADQIVTEIAKKFKLKPIVTPHPMRFSQQTIVSQTYWQKIQELAHRIGYVTQVYGTELHFHPIDVMINRNMNSVPFLAMYDFDANEYDTIMSHTLDQFTPKSGDLSARPKNSRRTKVISGIDPLTAVTYSESANPKSVGKSVRTSLKDPLFNESMPTLMTASKKMAETIAKGQAMLSRLSIEATGMGPGDPRIAPYKIVEINTNDQTTDGYWMISRAEHYVTHDGRYYTEFHCMTDGSGPNKAGLFRPTTTNGVAVRNVEFEMSTGVSIQPSYTKLAATTLTIKEKDHGYKVNPRRWVGK